MISEKNDHKKKQPKKYLPQWMVLLQLKSKKLKKYLEIKVVLCLVNIHMPFFVYYWNYLPSIR